MGLSCCLRFIKFMLLTINFLIWILGILVVALAAWMIADPTVYLSATQEETKYYAGLYIFLAVGAVLVIIAFLGCCGTVKESRCMLVTFFCIMLIGVVAQIAAVWWGATHTEHLKQEIRKSFQSTVKNEYDGYNTRSITFDTIQREMKCCGVSGPRDWEGSLYNRNMVKAQSSDESSKLFNKALSNIGLTAGQGPLALYVLPPSCCTEAGMLCEANRRLPITAGISPLIHSTGCIDRMFDLIEKNIGIMIGVVVGIIVLEVLSLIFSITLCCASDRSDRYKA